MAPLQNFIDESYFLFAITPSSPTGSLSGIPINTDPVTVDYKTSRKTTPKTTTRGQNIVRPQASTIVTTTTKLVSSATQSTNQTTEYQAETTALTTAQTTACPTIFPAVTTTTIPTMQGFSIEPALG